MPQDEWEKREADSGDQPPPGTNPTDILTRGDVKYKFIKSQSGAETHAATVRLDYAVTTDVLVRVDVPYVDVDPKLSSIDSGERSDFKRNYLKAIRFC